MSDFKILCPEFKHNTRMPVKYTCQGEDISPQLDIEGIPSNTKSLALIIDDPDALSGSWVHWILFNIPSTIKRIEENTVPKTASEGKNSWGNNNYRGPCPPFGTHRYIFKLYALDIALNLSNPSKQDIEKAMQDHILSKIELIGLYSKK